MSDLVEIIAAKWFGRDFCWKCGGKGYWQEQIDGPDNLRTVYCENPACWPKTVNVDSAHARKGVRTE